MEVSYRFFPVVVAMVFLSSYPCVGPSDLVIIGHGRFFHFIFRVRGFPDYEWGKVIRSRGDGKTADRKPSPASQRVCRPGPVPEEELPFRRRSQSWYYQRILNQERLPVPYKTTNFPTTRLGWLRLWSATSGAGGLLLIVLTRSPEKINRACSATRHVGRVIPLLPFGRSHKPRGLRLPLSDSLRNHAPGPSTGTKSTIGSGYHIFRFARKFFYGSTIDVLVGDCDRWEYQSRAKLWSTANGKSPRRASAALIFCRNGIK